MHSYDDIGLYLRCLKDQDFHVDENQTHNDYKSIMQNHSIHNVNLRVEQWHILLVLSQFTEYVFSVITVNASTEKGGTSVGILKFVRSCR